MTKKQLLSAAIIVALSGASTAVHAAGFQLNSQSATGLGRAFAGDAVIADNASVAARNPAAMALFKEANFSLGFNFIDTDVRVKSGTYHQPKITTSIFPPSVDFDSNAFDIGGTDGIGASSFVPNMHLVMPINEQWAWGLSAYSNFGTGTEFDDDFAASLFGGTTSVKSMNFAANVSYLINEQWSVGAGLDLIYGMGDLKRGFDAELCNKPLFGEEECRTVKEDVIDVEATGFAVGWNIGAVYELNENHRFGLSYRYSPTVKADGDDPTDKIDLPLPDMAEFSGYHRLTDKFAAHYSLQWVQWSAFNSLQLQTQSDLFGILPSMAIDKAYEWKDAGHISIGGTYYLNDSWTLRTGYMYDIAATDELMSISIPDSNRHWFSAGFTYHPDSKQSIDFGFTYLMGEDVTFDESLSPSLPAPSITGATTRSDAILVGLQYSRSF
ncbi:aromatic hydrocarbon degradation protein [Photobacterium sanctipauli]|uniref:Aromatic hydrocarbon degradation protein n=1 Tax=Photobacterium sanctipauli TaxID=1342794 RepID=A0A2T3P175_9GAMM|nr:outer membrane protein transport protein [Photobacterium sanctipauli]PSW22283.1 aromatic hydrocarbon degradation protein [Photobacterium sanctipauli]